jgi:hypothetical protein
MEKSLRRKESLTCVRIFHFGSGRKTANIDVTAVRRERAGNQALFAGHWSSVKQAALSFFLRGRGCLRRANVVPIRRRRNWTLRSLAIRNIAWRSLIIPLPTALVRLRLRFRVRDRAAQRPKKIPEWSRFRRFSRGEQSEDRQPDDNSSERPFHNNDEYWPHHAKNASPARICSGGRLGDNSKFVGLLRRLNPRMNANHF